MRYFYTLLPLLFVLLGFAQTNHKTIISGMIITSDSIPVFNAAIIHTRTFKTVRTDSLGFFQTELEGNDSLLVYHIAYKKLFINEDDNAKWIVVEPEMHELKQVDIKNDHSKTLATMMKDIKEIAQKKKLSKEELKSSSQKFTDQQGSHNKAFVPFFGPTTHVSLGKIAELVGSQKTRHQRKQLTSHYHLVKKKSIKRKK